MEELVIEIYVESEWKKIGTLQVSEPKKSSFSSSHYLSDLAYFFEHLEHEDKFGLYSVSKNIPLSATNKVIDHWPSFLLDLMPQGSARANICKRYKFVDSQENDFLVLKYGALNPIGNVRIKPQEELFNSDHPGFEQEDIIEKNELFLEHAMQFGAIVVGTSGTQGMAPKFLVNIDKENKWHCDGALADEKITRSYLAKMPRGKTQDDKLVLEHEEKYLKIARELGLKSIEQCFWKNDVLFVERFDRSFQNQSQIKLNRYGVESLSSIAGQYQFGISLTHEEAIEIIDKTSTQKNDLFEYVARDFLNIVMGNTDNHTRNTAFIKRNADSIELSPIYDFAPMALDPEMIVRSCKWEKERANIPEFEHIYHELLKYRSQEEVQNFFKTWLVKIQSIEELTKKYQFHKRVIDIALRSYPNFLEQMKNFTENL